MVILLPDPILASIQKHIRRKSISNESGWDAGKDEEDTLTGHYLSNLQTDRWVRVYLRDRSWKWKITYKKFGSKGKDAPEKYLGADGIVQIELQDLKQRVSYYKGMLFQAKKLYALEAIDQARTMEAIAPDGSCIILYGPQQYEGIASKELLESEDKLEPLNAHIRLGDLIADSFLQCLVGLRGLHYDGNSLIVPHETDGVIRFRRRIQNRLTILVQAPELI